jgi:hypothetical protein
MSSRLSIPLAALVIAVALPATVATAEAQSGATPAAASPELLPKPGVKRIPIAKSVFGDAGMIVNARDDGFIEIAAAGPKKTVLLQLRTLAARAWVDSTFRMLKARPRRSATPRTYRSDIEEYGSSGTMALTRKVTGGESEYALFFSDDPLTGFTIPIEKSEADIFVAQVRKAVAQSAKMVERADTTGPRADSATVIKKKKPAARRPAKPPAPASTTPAAPKPAAAKPVTPA